MKFSDLEVLFKGVKFKSDRSDDIKTYILNLLQKFEVALLWDVDSLLLPSLLPSEEAVNAGLLGSQVIVSHQQCHLFSIVFFSMYFYLQF